MWRFIIVTFGFLAVAFYQLSGGADYAPREGSRQQAALKAAEPVAKSNLPRVAAAPAAVPAQGDAKVILASTAPEPMRNDRVRLVIKGTINDTSNVTTVAADPGKIAKLVAAASTRTAPKPKPTPAVSQAAIGERGFQDLRKVASQRVNMRAGPGKDHEVIGKLTRGTEVEVTQDDGSGWVQLRVVDTGEEGWMADFLLVAAN